MDAKKLKLIVKGEKKPTFGTDPNEPWSVRAGITESEAGMLHAYLRSRGINPQFVGKDTKISHSKSSEFQKWKRDHMFDDPADYVSSVAREKIKAQRAQAEEVEIEEGKTLQHTPVELRQHALNREKHMTKVLKHNGLHKEGYDDHEEIAKELIRRHGMNVTKDHLKAIENERDTRGALDHDAVMTKVRAMGAMTEAKKPKMTALDRFRKAAAEREKKHAEIQQKSGGMTAAIDRLEKHLNKEAADAGVSKAKETKFHTSLDKLVHKTFGPSPSEKKEKQKMKKEEIEQIDELNYDTVKSLYKKRRDDFHGDQVGKNKKGKEVSAKNVSRSISRLMGFKPTQNQSQKEEVEQIDEISKSTLDSYRDKSSASLKTAQTNRDAAEPGKNMSKGFADLHAKSNAIAKKRVKGLMGYLQRKQGVKPMSEDVFQDTMAATQTAFDMGTQADDREPTYSKRKEMSKSARMIKSLYKKHKMVKEDLYDHEKEDKSVATYGKKPKVEKQEVYGDDDTQAAMVLKGGKTLTGQTRDTLEIDPVMRKANKNNDNQT
jgi:hypothetical protein